MWLEHIKNTGMSLPLSWKGLCHVLKALSFCRLWIMFYVLLRIICNFEAKQWWFNETWFLFLAATKAFWGLCAHSNYNCHSIRHFAYKHTVESNMSACINMSSDCLPERMVTLDVESTVNFWFIMLMLLLCSLAWQ